MAVSAIILRRSTLHGGQQICLASKADRTDLSVSTVRDFQTGPLEPGVPADRSSGVIGLDVLGVVAPEAAADGEFPSSSIANMSSSADELGVGRRSGLVTGDGLLRRPFLIGVTVVVDVKTGDLGFHLQGCRTFGVGISCTASHSRCFSIAWPMSSPERETDSFFPCFSEMTRDKSSRTSSSMSSSSPLSSIVSMHEMM